MDDPGMGTRVEIELTANDDSRLRRRKSSAATAEAVTHDDGTGTPAAPLELEAQLPPGSAPPPNTIERSKLVVGAAAVAIVALFVGWALGRSGEPSATDAAQPEATIAATSPSETPPLAEIPTSVLETAPATTRPRARSGPTTTTLPEWETTTIDVDPLARALGIQVVVIGNGISEIDTATGEMRTLATNVRFNQPPLVDAGADWIVIRNLDSGESQLVQSGGLPTTVRIGDSWSTFFDHNTGLFWRTGAMYQSGEPTGVAEIDHEGNETGRTFDIPPGVWAMAGDPAGGVLVGAPGGTYQVSPDGVRRVTTGTLLTLNERIAVVTGCGDDFSNCGLFRIDRATGESTQVALQEAADFNSVFDLQSPAFWGNPELIGGISPDDRWAPVMASSSSSDFGLIDLTTGEYVSLAEAPPSGFWWSPDGRVVIYNQDARLVMFDTVERTSTDVVPRGVAAQAFAVRPPI